MGQHFFVQPLVDPKIIEIRRKAQLRLVLHANFSYAETEVMTPVEFERVCAILSQIRADDEKELERQRMSRGG